MTAFERTYFLIIFPNSRRTVDRANLNKWREPRQWYENNAKTSLRKQLYKLARLGDHPDSDSSQIYILTEISRELLIRSGTTQRQAAKLLKVKILLLPTLGGFRYPTLGFAARSIDMQSVSTLRINSNDWPISQISTCVYLHTIVFHENELQMPGSPYFISPRSLSSMCWHVDQPSGGSIAGHRSSFRNLKFIRPLYGVDPWSALEGG